MSYKYKQFPPLAEKIREIKIEAVDGKLKRNDITADEYDKLMNKIIKKCDDLIEEIDNYGNIQNNNI